MRRNRWTSDVLTIVHEAEVSFQTQQLITPLQLSSGTISSVTEAIASVAVETAGRRAIGRGAVYLSHVWAWPDAAVAAEQKDAALRKLCEYLASALPHLVGPAPLHPLEIGLRIHDLACESACESSPPELARALCASPFDAAVHDGAGIAVGKSAFDFYDAPVPIPSADAYFPEGGTCRAVAALLQPPRKELPAWHIVSKDDVLRDTLMPAIKRQSIYCIKLKLTGRDNDADVARTVQVYRAAAVECDRPVRLTIDSNEANPSADSVLDFLVRLEGADSQAYAALEYIEQPTHRDIRRYPWDWRPIAERKPVLLDEGLGDLSNLAEALRQGYSGLALKTCKGHSMLLATAAWARQRNMRLALQDLTNPGIALIHGALVGSRLPTINGAELNSPQFSPAANADFLPRLRPLFEPKNGVHILPQPSPPGLGSQL